MQTRVYLNGSGSTLQRDIQKIEQRINKLSDFVQKSQQEKLRPENGFLKFIKPLIDRSQN